MLHQFSSTYTIYGTLQNNYFVIFVFFQVVSEKFPLVAVTHGLNSLIKIPLFMIAQNKHRA